MLRFLSVFDLILSRLCRDPQNYASRIWKG
jgi:hypothetical protein